MANTPLSSFLSLLAPKSIQTRVLRRKSTRLTGDLAVGETIALSASASEVINTFGALRLAVRFKTSGAGVPQLTVAPVLADGATAAATGTRVEAPGAATEGLVTLDLYGEEEVSLSLEETGGAAAMDIVFVDVYLI